ncbi:MAG: vitamin K epoxide reductase family protein [Verrucomicrobiota bacterium]
MNPARLSRELRTAQDSYLKQRRAIAGLSLVAIGAMGIISLYQLGIIKHLPQPPLPKLDADRVDASAEAYSLFDTPDAVLGLGNYAVTLGLAAMGGKDRAKTRPWIPLALAAKAGFDALQGVRLTVDQTVKQKAYCIWCLVAAAASVALFPLSLAEARAAVDGSEVRSKKRRSHHRSMGLKLT